MDQKPPALLLFLLKIVPALPRQVEDGLLSLEVYDLLEKVIDAQGSREFIEWEHLRSMARQTKAFLTQMEKQR